MGSIRGTIVKRRELFTAEIRDSINNETVTLQDVTTALCALSEECSVIEIQNNKDACIRAINKALELEKVVGMLKVRLRAVSAEISYSRKKQ